MTNSIRRIGLLALLAFAAAAAHAGQERYDYDALGRLIRFINPAGEGTEYVYDAVGNILAVRQVLVQPPRISGVAPAAVRHNASVPVVVTGTDLLGATVTAADPGLRISGLRSSATEVSFDLLPASTVPIGAQPFTLASSTGSAGFSLTVKPELPRVIATPATVILSPGGQTMALTVALSNADVDAHRLALAVTDPTVASISAVTLDFPAGQTQASLTVTSGALGTSAVELSSATLAPAKVGIFVSGDEGPGDRLRLSAQVGVTREPHALTQPAGPFASAAVGVVREPQALTQPVGPFASPAVGVMREPQALAQPTGPFVSPAVGVTREPQAVAQPLGPFVSPAVGVDKGL